MQNESPMPKRAAGGLLELAAWPSTRAGHLGLEQTLAAAVRACAGVKAAVATLCGLCRGPGWCAGVAGEQARSRAALKTAQDSATEITSPEEQAAHSARLRRFKARSCNRRIDASRRARCPKPCSERLKSPSGTHADSSRNYIITPVLLRISSKQGYRRPGHRVVGSQKPKADAAHQADAYTHAGWCTARHESEQKLP